MSTYLENYGKGEEKRQRLVKSASIFVLLVLICTGLGWYILHNRKEDAAVSNFVELLRKKDYQPPMRCGAAR
jgi:hypothetical protein